MQVIRDNPVTREEREALNRPARAIMNVASDAIFESYLRMTPAPIIERPGAMRDDWITSELPVDDQTSLGSPRVPPLRPPTGGSIVTTPSDGGQGPILSGGLPTVSVPSSGPSPRTEPAHGPSGPFVIGPPAVPGTLEPGRLSTPRHGGGTGSVAPQTRGAQGTPSMVTPPVIGARPATSGWAPAVPFGSAQGSRRTNPVGGVLGSSGHAAIPRRRREGDHWRHRDDQGPFVANTDRAVKPVLEPDPEPPFTDPGPAIGLDR